MKILNVIVLFLLISCSSAGDANSLFKAIHQDDINAVNTLSAKKDLLSSFNLKGLTPLVYAIELERFKAVKTLLQNGANPNQKIKTGSNALNYSLYNEDTKYLEVLLRFGGNVNIENEAAQKELIFRALSPTRKKHLELIVEAGADLNVTDGTNFTPLMIAATLNQYDTILYLLDKGANPHMVGNWDTTLATLLEEKIDRESESMKKARLEIMRKINSTNN